MPDTTAKLNVLIWRTQWLSYSETFVELQARNLPQSSAVYAGLSLDDRGRELGARSVVTRGRFIGALERLVLSRLGRSSRLLDIVRARNIDVIHAHFGPDAVFISKFCRRYSIPLVLTLHGYDVSSMATGSSWRVRRYRGRLKETMSYASAVICVSGHVRRLALELGSPPERSLVHYVGVEIPTTARNDGPRKGLLFVGRLVEKKGLVDLIRALARVDPPQRDTPLTVIGRGPLEDELKQLAEKLALNITFRGALPHSKVLQEITSATAVVVPSRQASGGDVEGLPTVIMEALSRGIPVIGTRHSGIPEAVRDGLEGLLSAEGDVDGLAANLNKFLAGSPEEHQRMATLARARAEQLFDVRVQASSLEDLYAGATQSATTCSEEIADVQTTAFLRRTRQ